MVSVQIVDNIRRDVTMYVCVCVRSCVLSSNCISGMCKHQRISASNTGNMCHPQEPTCQPHASVLRKPTCSWRHHSDPSQYHDYRAGQDATHALAQQALGTGTFVCACVRPCLQSLLHVLMRVMVRWHATIMIVTRTHVAWQWMVDPATCSQQTVSGQNSPTGQTLAGSDLTSLVKMGVLNNDAFNPTGGCTSSVTSE